LGLEGGVAEGEGISDLELEEALAVAFKDLG